MYIEYITVQVKKIVHEYRRMSEKVQTLIEEYYPKGNLGQRLQDFLEEARGQYEQIMCKGPTYHHQVQELHHATSPLDNGSSLNVIQMCTLSRLPFDLSYMKKSQMVVRAFDRTKREVLGNIELLV